VIRAVIFDFDGTLVPLALNFDRMREEIESIAARYVDADEIAELHSLYTLEFIYTIQTRLNDQGARFRAESFERLCALEVQAVRGNAPYPYTKNVLTALRESGIKIGVISRNCLAAIRTVFPTIEEYVDAIATRDDTDLVKPNPAHVEVLLAKLGVKPDETLLVGDHPTDIMAGRAAKARTVGVLAGRTGRNSFAEAGADRVVADIRSLIEILESDRRKTPH